MQMMDYMRRWVDDMDADDREITINSLTKVRFGYFRTFWSLIIYGLD